MPHSQTTQETEFSSRIAFEFIQVTRIIVLTALPDAGHLLIFCCLFDAGYLMVTCCCLLAGCALVSCFCCVVACWLPAVMRSECDVLFCVFGFVCAAFTLSLRCCFLLFCLFACSFCWLDCLFVCFVCLLACRFVCLLVYVFHICSICLHYLPAACLYACLLA